MKTHELKTWADPFEAVWDGRKQYEIRKDDRDFHVGDSLHLFEFVPHDRCEGSGHYDFRQCCETPHGLYTGRELHARVTYKTEGGKWGLPQGLCVLGIKEESRS